MKKLLFSFDIGHASIGWAVLDTTQAHEPQLQGCGSVLFPTDDCLASQRRQLRRQRRHIRSTRMRIARMKRLLVHLGALTQKELDEPGGPWPWKLAARVHAGGSLLSWSELWDVLRWYAHNRGYDGNRKWSRDEGENPEDTEKEKAARALMDKLNMPTMCQTICAKLKVDPLSDDKKSSSIAYKTANAAFPREVVLHEVRELMKKHIGKLPQVTPALIEALCAEDNTPHDGKTVRDVLKQLGFDAHLPARFVGGLLFGQAVPRFDNRIIGECPVSGDKRPLKDCREYLEFRWAEIVANITVRRTEKGDKESLNPDERVKLTALSREAGGFTAKDFIKAVNDITKCVSSNAEAMMTTPDAEEALVLDPARRFTRTNGMMKAVWEHLPKALQSRITGRWNKHRRVTWAWMLAQSDEPAKLEATLKAAWNETKRKPRKGDAEPKWEDRVKQSIAPPFPSGRAPYGRKVMMQAVDEVVRGLHPREKGGVLEMTEARLDKERAKEIDELTNNHLVRHRLKILLRLVKDMVKEYADDKPEQVERCVIEVARDLVEFSGKTNKEVAQELGIKLKNFKDVSKRLTDDLEETNVPISAGLIRKARIADDLDWTCPYTLKKYDAVTLARGGVDKDHIIPRSARPSDSMDSLVVTFGEVNKWKGNRTARKFVEEEQEKVVPGRPELSICTLRQYEAFVNKLAGEKRPSRFTGGAGSLDDKRRQWNRKQKLMLRDYEEKEFTPGDLTVTSHLVRLSARQIEKHFKHLQDNKSIISIPGSVTGMVRKAWDCLGCLAPACPEILHLAPEKDDRGQLKFDADGNVVKKMQPRPKGDIRDITHLHHALDACVMAYASIFLPNNGRLWEQIITRKVRQSEAATFHQSYGWNKMLALRPPDEGSPNGASLRLSVRDLPKGIKEQISKRLEERRVVQHVPADMSGARLELNTWGVVKTEGDQVTLRQRTFGPNDIDAETGARKRKTKITTEKASKLVGMKDGKLSAIQGALVIGENYGVALEPEPTMIPFHTVRAVLDGLIRKNGGRAVRVLRNGMLIAVEGGDYTGVWRIRSCKDNAKMGLVVTMTHPDRCPASTSGVTWCKDNVRLKTLIKSGLTILDCGLVGPNAAR
jgi:hypothetical protein